MTTRPRDAKEARLLKIPLFKDADSEALRHLSAAADEASLPAGHILIHQGRHHHECYVLESGSATVEVNGEPIAEITEGEFVGELGFFVRATASATVRAKTDLDVLVIPYNRLDQVLDDNPGLVRAIAKELAIRLHETDARLH
jgi:CRP-like cAMP-binding protein